MDGAGNLPIHLALVCHAPEEAVRGPAPAPTCSPSRGCDPLVVALVVCPSCLLVTPPTPPPQVRALLEADPTTASEKNGGGFGNLALHLAASNQARSQEACIRGAAAPRPPRPRAPRLRTACALPGTAADPIC